MSTGSSAGWRSLGCAAALGAVVALPIGVFIGASGWQDGAAPSSGAQNVGGGGSGVRDVYSPQVLNDPYVIEQQRRVAEALELSCRQSGSHCEEARQARLRISETESKR